MITRLFNCFQWSITMKDCTYGPPPPHAQNIKSAITCRNWCHENRAIEKQQSGFLHSENKSHWDWSLSKRKTKTSPIRKQSLFFPIFKTFKKKNKSSPTLQENAKVRKKKGIKEIKKEKRKGNDKKVHLHVWEVYANFHDHAPWCSQPRLGLLQESKLPFWLHVSHNKVLYPSSPLITTPPTIINTSLS